MHTLMYLKVDMGYNIFLFLFHMSPIKWVVKNAKYAVAKIMKYNKPNLLLKITSIILR